MGRRPRAKGRCKSPFDAGPPTLWDSTRLGLRFEGRRSIPKRREEGFAPLRRTRLTRAGSAGFTLIELLVVIAILELLIGILLPVLSSARDTARSTICLANQRQILAAVAVYAVDHDGHLPGPNTSGYARNQRFEGRASSPISADDWYSPILGDALGLPDNWADRAVAIFNDEFRCPMNTLTYNYVYPSGSGLPPADGTQLSSYGSPMGLHHYKDRAHVEAAGRIPNQALTMGSANFDARQVDVTAAKYDFRIDTVGPPSGKAFLYDGVRYVERAGKDWRVSWSTQERSNYGTNFVTRSPVLNANFAGNGHPHFFANRFDPDNLSRATQVNAFRHAGQTMGMGFLDGHVETVDSRGSRKVSYYFPSGSRIERTNNLADTSVQVGDVVE
ncbi:MAG: prepilin-type N-terminal cleavage/methylation domain-containing protein [Planctomycetota bacterium]